MAPPNLAPPRGSCLTPEALSDFYLGKLGPGRLQAVADHLEDCPGCQSSLQALEGKEDALVAGLRHSGSADPFREEPACRQVLRQVEALAPDAAAEAGPAALGRLGQYELLARLGEGGMGVVYRALHPRLKRVVALKVLSAGRVESAAAVARFQREMEAAGKLDHPNIVRASDAGEVDGTHFLVMELVEGLDLARLVKACGPLPVADACELVRQAALGLQHAHEHGLVHRDVKPSNLMLDSRGQVKVLDLGLARLQTERPAPAGLTAAGQVLGTCDYMAPEQWDDTHAVDARADVYSLGCTLYYLLAGRPPFAGPQYATVRSKLAAHARDPVPPVTGREAPLPAELAAVLGRLLAKEPAGRFATPAEVADALAPFTAGHDLPALLARARREEEAGVRPGDALAGTDAPLASALVGTRSSVEQAGKGGQEAQAPGTASPGPSRRSGRRFAVLAAVLLVLLGAGLAASQVLRMWNPLGVMHPDSAAPGVSSRQEAGPVSDEPPPDQPAAPATGAAADQQQGQDEAPGNRARVYTAALFAFEERGQGTKELGAKVTDLLYARLGARPDLELVEREDLKRTLAEAELGLSGAVKPAQAARVGQLTGARLLITGSVLGLDKKLYLVARVTGTETGRVVTTSVDGAAGDELGPLTDKLAEKLVDLIGRDADKLMAPPARAADRLAALAEKLKRGKKPTVIVDVPERHVGAAPADPAAQTELTRFLKGCGFEVLDADEAPRGAADVLIRGEGVSELGTRRAGLVSVKARVEVKAVDRRSGRVLVSDRQTAVVIDLSEQLAGKAALQEAAAALAERLLPKLVQE